MAIIRHVAAVVLLVLVAPRITVHADDVAVDDHQAANGPLPANRLPSYDLQQIFDSQVFGHQMRMGVQRTGPEPTEAEPDGGSIVKLLPVRQRAQARIDMVDQIVGLSAKQREKLQIALESDLRRLADHLDAARGKYVGRKLQGDPREEALRRALQEVREDAARCQRLVQEACGRDTLLAKVLMGSLDGDQAAKYAAAVADRRACRWKALVAAGLAPFDDQLGLTQKQYEQLQSMLLADVPALVVDQQSFDPAASDRIAVMLVAARLGKAGDDKLAAILDERQRKAVPQLCAAAQRLDEAILVAQGVLESKP
jgi:hypothetical protein